MRKIVITGGRRLKGHCTVHGAKNALLPILAASLMASSPVTVENCPPLADVLVMEELLRDLGCRVTRDGQCVHIDARTLSSFTMNERLMHRLRSSIFMLGPLLGRMKQASVGYPGGCDIGIRPIDLHLKGLRQLGARITEADGRIVCRTDALTGGEIYLDYPSVGATENIMMAASLASGATVILNAAKEPEIVDLQAFINKMGGRVSGGGTGRIVIHGVKTLNGCTFSAIPDRIVTGTYMIAGAITGGEITVSPVIPEHIAALTRKLREGGCRIEEENDTISLAAPARLKSARRVETLPYPGFPTDLQSPMMALEAVADGTCFLTENVFENRFRLAGELNKMGAEITVRDRMAVIRGTERLTGTTVYTHDLRGGAALVLAGLKATGRTTVWDDGLIARGYGDLCEQLRLLGAEITDTEEDHGQEEKK